MRRTTLLVLTGLAATGVALAQTSQNPPTTRWAYIQPGQFDLLQVLPPAPVKGDARWDADRRTFRLTRKLIGTPRWDMATADVVQKQPEMLANMSCPAGIVLTAENAPRTAELLRKATLDTSRENTAV